MLDMCNMYTNFKESYNYFFAIKTNTDLYKYHLFYICKITEQGQNEISLHLQSDNSLPDLYS